LPNNFIYVPFSSIIGDPTVFGNLQPAIEILDAMKEVIDEKNFNGYAPSVGFIEARQAVAEYSAHQVIKGREINAKDVSVKEKALKILIELLLFR
jgi:aspartate/methionine/tyrosine aminotransferase